MTLTLELPPETEQKLHEQAAKNGQSVEGLALKLLEDALAFYAECGLGQVVEILRYGENGMPAKSEAMRGKVMHAKFEGPGVLFFASDNDDAEPMRGSAHILMLRDREQTRLLFEQSGRGGRVTTALGVQPWGDYYGKLTDRFVECSNVSQ